MIHFEKAIVLRLTQLPKARLWMTIKDFSTMFQVMLDSWTMLREVRWFLPQQENWRHLQEEWRLRWFEFRWKLSLQKKCRDTVDYCNSYFLILWGYYGMAQLTSNYLILLWWFFSENIKLKLRRRSCFCFLLSVHVCTSTCSKGKKIS